MRNSLFSLLSLGATAALIGCDSKSSGGGGSGGGENGGTLVVVNGANPQQLFPPLVREIAGRFVQDQVFDRLAEIRPSLETTGDKVFDPRLAKSWTWSNDSLSIAFSIDPRARWHDGKPVTARDVQYSFNTFVDPKVGSPTATLLTNIDSVSVRDSLTAVFHFKKHTPEQFYDVAYQIIVMPEHVYGAVKPESLATSAVARAPIGSGRFRFVKWEPDVRLELIADTANYRGRAKLDRVILMPTEPTVAEARIMSGEGDFLDAFPIDHVPQLDTSTVAQAIVNPQLGYVYMGMNRYDPKAPDAPHPIFSDARVRRALAIAVDRQGMLQNVFGKSGRISHGPFPVAVRYADTTVKVPAFDTTAAKAMLDSAGWRVGANGVRSKNGRPLRFRLAAPMSSLFRRKYAVLLQEQLRRIGANVDVDIVDPGKLAEQTQLGDFDAVMGGFSTDPGVSGMKQPWATSGIDYVKGKGVQGQNALRYSNPKADVLIDSAMATFDPNKTKQYAARASQIIIDDVPAIFLYDIVVVHALNRRVTPVGIRGDEWWANLADWTIPPAKRIDRDRIGLGAKP